MASSEEHDMKPFLKEMESDGSLKKECHDKIEKSDCDNAEKCDSTNKNENMELTTKTNPTSPGLTPSCIQNGTDYDTTYVSHSEVSDNALDTDPVLVWSSVRPWAALNISCWDFLCDKAKWAEYPGISIAKNQYLQNAHAYKIQVRIYVFGTH